MSPGQMLPGQMSPRELKSIQYGPRNLPIKFGQNRVSKSWDIAGIEFSVVVGGGGGGGGGGWCAKSFFRKTQT